MLHRLVSRALLRPVHRVAPSGEPVSPSNRPTVAEKAPITGRKARVSGIRQELRKRQQLAACKTEADVSDYVSSILTYALKATAASTDLTLPTAGPVAAPETGGIPGECVALPHDYQPASSQQLQASGDEEGEEREDDSVALQRELGLLGFSSKRHVLDDDVSEIDLACFQAEGVPASELDPECPDDRWRRPSPRIAWAEVKRVKEIPPRGTDPPYPTLMKVVSQPSSIAEEVDVAVCSRCFLFALLKRYKAKSDRR